MFVCEWVNESLSVRCKWVRDVHMQNVCWPSCHSYMQGIVHVVRNKSVEHFVIEAISFNTHGCGHIANFTTYKLYFQIPSYMHNDCCLPSEHTALQTSNDFHAWRLGLGSAAAHDIPVNYSWPAQNVLQTGGVFLATVQEQQACVLQPPATDTFQEQQL